MNLQREETLTKSNVINHGRDSMVEQLDIQNNKKMWWRNMKFGKIDQFGTMLGFHIRGAGSFQTKLGAFYTILYFISLCSIFYYYLRKWIDRSSPNLVSNEYTSDSFHTIN